MTLMGIDFIDKVILEGIEQKHFNLSNAFGVVNQMINISFGIFELIADYILKGTIIVYY